MENENRECEDKTRKVSLLHFVYFLIIFLIIIVAILSLEFGGSTRAGENLNFGATLASIILAVIAILYTMFEGASQRDTSKTISRSVRNLRQSTEEFMVLTKDIKEQYSEMQKFNEELLQKVIDNEEWRTSVMNEIKAKAKGQQGTSNTIEINQIEEIMEKTRERNRIRHSLSLSDFVIKVLQRNPEKRWKVSEINVGLRHFHAIVIPLSTLEGRLSRMVDEGVLIRYLEDDKVFFILSMDIAEEENKD